MAGIQISGLLSNSAFDWKSVVDQLIAVDGAPITALQKEKTKNTDETTALAAINNAFVSLQDSVQAIRQGNLFAGRTVSSDVANTTWKSSSAAGAPLGSYKFDIQQLATATQIKGTTDIGAGLSATDDDLSALTMSSLPTATSVKAGFFTVDGQQISFTGAESLQTVLNRVQSTLGDVSWTYSASNDAITLTRASGTLTLGAANDSSNFLQVMKLGNTGGSSSTSTGTLGTVKVNAPLNASGLRGSFTAVDGSGNGSFSINNIPISYNINTDTLGSVMSKINQSTAGVTATYDPVNDRFLLTNKSTGDTAINLSEPSGGFLDAVGITSGTPLTVAGKNAQFTVNGGPVITSASNTLDASSHGITGLSVTVNSQTAQTLQVESDTGAMQTALQSFFEQFNATQDLIDQDTKITVNGSSVSTAILSDNREVDSWSRQLRALAFNAVSGLTGTVKSFSDLGVDFDGTTSHLLIKDQGKLSSALADHPDDVQSFFLDSNDGMVPRLYGFLTDQQTADTNQQDDLNVASKKIDEQIATLQSRLDSEREALTNSFIKMLDAQSAAQSQNQALTNAFFKNSSN
jgi:flagellar hook-associated protein 2